MVSSDFVCDLENGSDPGLLIRDVKEHKGKAHKEWPFQTRDALSWSYSGVSRLLNLFRGLDT